METAGQPQSFTAVPSRVSSDELEREILDFWANDQIFSKSLKNTKNGERFTFYDGPPYATGKPHYGHILQSAIKDTVLRYKTMQGYYVPRRVGWDCHGLPVENLVEKELGIKEKKDIEVMGIDKFNQACRDIVFRYMDDFTKTLQRIGRWADYDNAYATLNPEYMETEWWVFRQLWDQDLVYKAFRSTPYCIRCATPLSNFEVSSNYQDKTDETVYVEFKVVGQDNTYLLVWTTTPWTLPANVAVAVNTELAYVSVQVDDKNFVVARDRVAALFGDSAEITHEWSKDELLQLKYEPIYAFLPVNDKAYSVVPGGHVTASDGTGLVHMAPAFGEEDALVGKEQGLPTLKTVDTNGKFVAEVTPWAGQKIFDVNAAIIADLQTKGVLFKQETYTHSYPFCWRCDTPLIYYALDTWFVRVEKIKSQLLANNEHINWVPKHVKHGRFGKGIESAPDWAVSRNRYWSVPVPIWECDKCDHKVCIGSVAELSKLSGQPPLTDLHRPGVDTIKWSCTECEGGTMTRVTEVLDVWFDSGSMPYAQWHYPFEHETETKAAFPADFIVEAIEMTRAWFYVLHVLATALTRPEAAAAVGLGENSPAFKNAVASGLIFAENGQKLSKKLKNYPQIEPTLEKYGADVLRFYLLTSSSLGEPYRFSEKDLQQLQRQVYMTLWNVYSFFVQYAQTHNISPEALAKGDGPTSKHILDQWIMARLAELKNIVWDEMTGYKVDTAGREFITFIDDLSNWYVRRSRARFQRPGSEEEKEAAFGTLYTVLVELSQWLAPFMPFVSEAIYRNLTGQTSVHLAKLTQPAAVTPDQTAILEQMTAARAVVSEGLALRAGAKQKVRQPLPDLVVITSDKQPSLSPELIQIIQDEVNVKEVLTKSELPTTEGYVQSSAESSVKVALQTILTPELAAEGTAREIIRHGQVLRRQAKYALNDRIHVAVQTDSPEIKQALATQRDLIIQTLQADSLETSLAEPDAEASIKVNGQEVTIQVKRT